MEPLTDSAVRTLSDRLVKGDPAALAELYEARFDWMLAMLMRLTRRDESFTLDCVQDAWLRIARAPLRVPCVGALDAWLRRVAVSAALDRLRSDAARRLRERRVAHTEVRSTLQSIESLRAALLAAVEQSDGEARGLLLMRFRAGMTLAQIAAACGIGAAAVDSRLRRLLGSLQDALKEEQSP